jgi:hypothetical protein
LNPLSTPASAQITYLLPNGVTRSQVVTLTGPGHAMERTMYARCFGGVWRGGHGAAASPAPATTWYLAEGATGGFFDLYVLIANTGDIAGAATVRVIFEDGTSAALPQPVPLASHSRTTLDLADVFPAARDRAFGITVDSLGAAPAPLVVELSTYSDTEVGGVRAFWGAGTNVLGRRVR